MQRLAFFDSFNSMKVRLKRNWLRQSHPLIQMFQFHEGPIKTLRPLWVLSLLTCFNSMKVRLKPKKDNNTAIFKEFQFHEGPIKTLRPNTLRVGVRSFNSMKVRLKRAPLGLAPLTQRGFNSMKVRLKRSTVNTVLRPTKVSIP